MRRPVYPEVKRCYDCGEVGHGFIIGNTQDIPLRFICEECIIKMYKIITNKS